jgi:hypothetical protein
MSQEPPFLPNDIVAIGRAMYGKTILDTGCLMLDKDGNWINTSSIQYQASSICPPERRQVQICGFDK